MPAETLANPSAAFSAVYDQYVDFTHRSLRRLGVPDALADDCVQEVFVIVHRRLGDFAGRSSLKTWLFGICLRVASDSRRKHARRSADGPVSADLVDPARLPDDQAERAQALATLDALLDKLDGPKRAVFVMAELEQLTAPEMAEVLNENLNTIYSRLRAARGEFEEALRRHRASQR